MARSVIGVPAGSRPGPRPARRPRRRRRSRRSRCPGDPRRRASRRGRSGCPRAPRRRGGRRSPGSRPADLARWPACPGPRRPAGADAVRRGPIAELEDDAVAGLPRARSVTARRRRPARAPASRRATRSSPRRPTRDGAGSASTAVSGVSTTSTTTRPSHGQAVLVASRTSPPATPARIVAVGVLLDLDAARRRSSRGAAATTRASASRFGGQQAQGYHGLPLARVRIGGGPDGPPLERVDVEERGPVPPEPGQDAVEDRPLDQVRGARIARWPAAAARRASRWRSPRRSRCRPGPAAARTGRRTPRPGAGCRRRRSGTSGSRAGRPSAGGPRRAAPSSPSSVGDVDRAAVEVELAHGVAGHRRRLADGRVVLPVGRPEPVRRRAARARAGRGTRGRGLEVAPLAGHPVQLDEGHLDLGMPVDRLARRPGPRAASTCAAARDAISRSRSSPTRPLPGDRGLDQVADAVQLVAPLQVAVLRARARGPGRTC